MAAFTCPDCESRFRLSNTPSGRKISCPECGFAFRPQDDETDADAESRPASRSKRKTRDDDDYDRPRKKAGSGAGLLIGLVLAGGFVLLAAVGGLVWFVMGREAPKHVAEGPPANAIIAPPPQGAPGAIVPPKAIGATGDLIAKTRRATALIRVDAGSRAASGSGFIIQSNGDTAYLITNHHVIDLRAEEPAPPPGNPGKFPGSSRPPGFPGRPGFGPSFPGFPGRPGANPPPQPKTKTRVTVVLDSGTADEQSLPAEVVAYDDEADLAALRITGARNLPAALDVSQNAPVAETLPVLIFGFPGGKSDITIGKGSISGLRYSDGGELTDVHINGEINPGNSGGPVVDKEGRLIGVAVATVVGKQIGFAVPAAELHKMLKGSVLGGVVLQVKQQGGRAELNGEIWRFDRGSKIRGRDNLHVQLDNRDGAMAPNEYLAVARLTDPMHKLTAPTLLYAPAPKDAVPPVGKGWTPLAGAQKVPLKISDQDAMGEFKLPAGSIPDATYAFQISYVNADGETIYTQPHPVRLTFPKNLKSVTLKITAPADEPSRRFLEETIHKTFVGSAVKTFRTPDGVNVEIDPVEDPQTIVEKIKFGDVIAVEGRTITVAVKSVVLPLPTNAEISSALAELKSSDLKSRTAAVDRLAKVYAPLPDRRVEVAKALEAQITDKDFWLRQATVRALVIWAGKENVVGLLKALDSDDVNTRKGIVGIIAKYKDPASAPALAKLLPSLAERGDASAALKAIGPAAEKAVIPMLKHSDSWAAMEACKILKDIGTAESIAPLQAILDAKPNFMVGPAATEALKAIQGRK